MADEVNYIDPSHNHLPGTNWQMLGHLKLGAGSSPNGTIGTWLMNALSDFRLPGDLVSRLLVSMEEATARLLSHDSIEGQFEYLEIVVLVAPEQASKGPTWGFFRVEKASVDSQSEGPNGHYVE